MLSKTHQKKLIANQLSWSKLIDCVCGGRGRGDFSHGAGTPGTKRDIAFSQLAVKGLKIGCL
jgi:hypothetical protein